MNEIIKLLKNLKLNKKSLGLIVVALCAVVLMVISEFSAFTEEKTITATDTVRYSAEYIEQTEKDLQRILERVDGAGKVQVMLTLESCYENIYATAYENDKKISETASDESIKEEYVTIKKGSSNEECVIVKVYEPEIKGVAVVCEGGNSTQVKKAITETVCALFDISTAKVSVTKMNIR